AAKNDLPVPQTYKEMDKATQKFARQEFKRAARDFGGQKIIIQEEINQKQEAKLITLPMTLASSVEQ
ncbi:MAG: hypothetical protein ACPGSN_12505, partial [Psychrobium sp.]